MYRHKQKRVRIGKGRRISVDEGIVDIIKALNKNGCSTIMSCQNNFNNIWIEFEISGARKLQKICRTHPDVDTDDLIWLLEQEWQYKEMNNSDWVAFRSPIKNIAKFRRILKSAEIL